MIKSIVMNTILITHNGVDIRGDEHGYVCLNDLWHAAGKPASKQPKYWKRLASVEELAKHYEAKSTGVNSDHPQLMYSTIGGGSATYAIRELALAYAGYLDVTLRALVYQVFLQQVDGAAPTLDSPENIERAFAGSTRRKKSSLQLTSGKDDDASYWKGYAEAMKEAMLLVAGKGVR